MTFWTDNRDPSKRTWQCFVCGRIINEYSDFVQHIIQEHEEGRDYVKCPVDICGAPVRDLPAHFKTKHPNRVMPKNGQLKATIWRDFSLSKKGGGTKIKTRKPTFKDGWYESKKMSGKKMFYRSSYEHEVFKCLDEDVDVKTFLSEPFKVPYYFGNAWHDYIPDLKIEYSDGAIEVWEVKPLKQFEFDQNQAKWKAMQEYAGKMGWGFTVITEKGISTLKRKVSQQKRQDT